jgi:hypothetical protein
MRFRQYVLSIALACATLLGLAPQAHAIVLYSSATRNTSAPTGAYLNSGWQYEGDLGGWAATVISKKFIITAGHIGAQINNNFVINGENHRTVKMWQDPTSDLRIFQTVGSYNFAAPLFKDSTELGRSVVIFGRGTQRGDDVIVNGKLKGWKWGASDSVLSWGRNAVAGVTNNGPHNSSLLRMTFDANGTTFEGAITGGDSGGGVFVKQGSIWKLAGINYSVDGPFSTNQDGSNSFSGTIFDRTELWASGYGFAQAGAPLNTSFYSTRISPKVAWIADVLNGRVTPTAGGTTPGAGGTPAPEPATALTAASLATIAMLRRRRRG